MFNTFQCAAQKAVRESKARASLRTQLQQTLPQAKTETGCKLSNNVAVQALGLHRATAKLGYVTTALFGGLVEQGFCMPDATKEGTSGILLQARTSRLPYRSGLMDSS